MNSRLYIRGYRLNSSLQLFNDIRICTSLRFLLFLYSRRDSPNETSVSGTGLPSVNHSIQQIIQSSGVIEYLVEHLQL